MRPGFGDLRADDVSSNLTKMLDARAERIRAVMNVYEQRQVTVGLLGRMVGRSSLETWRTLMATKEYRPFVRPGDQQTLETSLSALQRGQGIVIDLTAAITLFELDVLNSVHRLAVEVHVPQAVIDVVTEQVDEYRVSASGRPMMVTFKQGDKYFRDEISIESLREMLRSLERLRESLRQ